MIELLKLKSQKKIKSIGVLTSGGDAPGMNAAIRAVVRYGISMGCEIYGINRGYAGLLDEQITRLVESSVANTIQRGGTILKTSRCKEFHQKSYRKKAIEILNRHGIESLVVIGGDGSFRGADCISRESSIATVGVPGTIDNDIYGTDDTIGFDTAVNTAVEAIDRIRDTASSHDRLFIVEVMGRTSGYIALQVGINGGAETVIVPEERKSIAEIVMTIERGKQRGKKSSIIVIAETNEAEQVHRIADELALQEGEKPKVCILGHIQRGGKPTAHDRYLASILGASAVQAILAGKKSVMVGVKNNSVALTPFKIVTTKRKVLEKDQLRLAERLAI